MPSTSSNTLNISSAGLVKFDGIATFSGVTTTAHDVLLGAASNGITNLSAVTTDRILRSGGASADSAWTTNFKVNSSGIMTNSSQPSFFAYKSGNSTNVTGDGTVYKVPCNTKVYDQATNYSTSTSTFTAPVAGRYLFYGLVHSNNVSSGHTNALIQIVATSYTATLWNMNMYAIRVGGASQNAEFSGTCIINMAANDTAILQWTVTGGTKTLTAVGGALNGYPCAFAGVLLC